MSGEGQYREQAKKQWEKLDAEGRKIINNLIVADKDRTIWLENTEPKFTGKKGAKLIKVAFNTKSKQEAQGLYAELFSFFVYLKCCSDFLLYFL